MEYSQLAEKLSNLRKEYKDKFLYVDSKGLEYLKNKIDELSEKLRQIDASIGVKHTNELFPYK